VLIRKCDRVAHTHGLRQILRLVRAQQSEIAFQRGITGINVTEHSSFGGIAQFFLARDIELCTQLLSLIAVENAQGNADAHANSVYRERVIGG